MWAARRVHPDRFDEWFQELNAPIRKRNSDKVSQAEVDEEMALFTQAQGALR